MLANLMARRGVAHQLVRLFLWLTQTRWDGQHWVQGKHGNTEAIPEYVLVGCLMVYFCAILALLVGLVAWIVEHV